LGGKDGGYASNAFGPARYVLDAAECEDEPCSAGAASLSFARMGISQPHNLKRPPIEQLRPYGIRVSLPAGDPFRKLLGEEWHRLHWYPSPEERDAALAEMARKHQYSRAGDKPSLVFQKVEKLSESRGL